MAKTSDEFVSVCLPVRNGIQTLETAVRSVLTQEHDRLELVICDNASTDGTQEVCRRLAASDSRVVYHRQARDVGILGNFVKAMLLAKGSFIRWLSDDDWLAPNYLSRCLEAFADDKRLILVTTQISYSKPDGSSYTRPYDGVVLRSDDPIERFSQIMTYQADGMPVDPLYGLMRRVDVSVIHRRNMLREDEVFASKLALAGPWGHVPEVLAHRHLRCDSLSVVARRLGVPAWQARFSNSLECLELLRFIQEAPLTAPQRRQARNAIARMYARRHYLRLALRAGKLVRLMLSPLQAPSR